MINLTGTGTGTGAAPEINLKQSATTLTSGVSSYDFGSVAEGQSSSSILFTIENLGDADLSLTGSPDVVQSGANAADFVVTQPVVSTIAPLSNATFSITFTPSGQGARTATITIASNDGDEASYTFDVNGHRDRSRDRDCARGNRAHLGFGNLRLRSCGGNDE